MSSAELQALRDAARLTELEGRFTSTFSDKASALNQGLTVGSSDEIQSAILATAGGISNLVGEDDGTTWGQRYSDTHGQLNERMRDYTEEAPIEQIALEATGAIPAGIAGAGRLAASKVGAPIYNYAQKNIPKWLQMSLAGGAGGAAYGFNSGEGGVGPRLEKAAETGAISAVATPVLAKAVQVGAKGISAIASRIQKTLSNTAGDKADEIIRKAIEAEGLSPEEAQRVYSELGPQGTLMDIGENTRSLGRAIGDNSGEGKRAIKEMVDTRQTGQQGRLMGNVYEGTGMTGDTAGDFVAAIRSARETQAKPFYDAAYKQGIEMTNELQLILGRPSVVSAMKKAEKLAQDLGHPPGSEFGLLNRAHYAKMALDDQIAKNIRRDGKVTNQTRALIQSKNEMLAQIDKQNPDYAKGRQLWSDASSLENSVDTGRKLFKMNGAEIRELTEGMTDSEKLGFKSGAVEAIQELMDNVGENHNAVNRLLGKKSMQSRMKGLFDDDASFDAFMKESKAENEFMRTRGVTTGGSPTSQNLKGQEVLDAASQGQAFYQTDNVGRLVMLSKKLFGSEEVDPALIKELTARITNKNMTNEQLAKMLSISDFGRLASKKLGTTNPTGTAAAIIPILENSQ